jgi:hypothetical protein
MKFNIRSLLLTMTMLLMGIHFQSNVFAHSDHDKDANVIRIADIVIGIQHYASAEDQKHLQAIVDSDSSTEHEKVIATVIMNIQHQASAGDKQKLQEIIVNTAPTSTVSALATIVHGFSHGISVADKRKLQTIKFKG